MEEEEEEDCLVGWLVGARERMAVLEPPPPTLLLLLPLFGRLPEIHFGSYVQGGEGNDERQVGSKWRGKERNMGFRPPTRRNVCFSPSNC